MNYPNARDCEHGSLRRKCERCADASEIAALEARLAEVRRERDDLEVSMATVAAGFEQARARVAEVERERDARIDPDIAHQRGLELLAMLARAEAAEARVATLEAELREAKSDLLRYGRHDSDCPAREYVMVDGIPTTCDCGLDAALAPASDQLPVPEQTTEAPEHPDPERWPGTTERPWFVEGLTAMDRFRSRVIFFVGDSDQDRADLEMIVEAVNAYCPSAWTPEVDRCPTCGSDDRNDLRWPCRLVAVSWHGAPGGES